MQRVLIAILLIGLLGGGGLAETAQPTPVDTPQHMEAVLAAPESVLVS